MPLKPGSSKTVVSGNIREMVKSGHPQKAALSNARKKKKKIAPRTALGDMARVKNY